MTSTPPPPSPTGSSDLPVPESPGEPENPGILRGLESLESLESRTLPPSAAARSRLSCSDAEKLSSRIQQQAAMIAEATCELLLMIGEFDAREGVVCFEGLKSTAHWLAWTCSMSPGTAREHVRVARALPRMPLTVAEFRAGRLSYSKVREMTRLVDRVEEAALVDLARAATASQLGRTISSFRALDGTRLGQDAVRQAHWQIREDGMIEIRAVLPAEMGAELITALELALDRDGTEPPQIDSAADGTATGTGSPDGPTSGGPRSGGPTSGGPRSAISRADELSEEEAAELAADITTAPTLEQRRADALLDLARTYLDAEPDDRSGEDRHLVIILVCAAALSQNGPAGTPSAAPDPTDVPAGTSERCGVLGMGPLEIRTAERLACTGKVAITITDAGGEILHLGRSRRLASRAQRRALRLRDTTCSFPGCHQSQHLDAHHVVPWSEGGLTDIDGLALLCRRHHVMVHEGGLRLVPGSGLPDATSSNRRFAVVDAEGRPIQARWPAMLEHFAFRGIITTENDTKKDATRANWAGGGNRTSGTTGAALPSTADPERIASTTGGEGFRLADCVDVLCRNVVELAA